MSSIKANFQEMVGPTSRKRMIRGDLGGIFRPWTVFFLMLCLVLMIAFVAAALGATWVKYQDQTGSPPTSITNLWYNLYGVSGNTISSGVTVINPFESYYSGIVKFGTDTAVALFGITLAIVLWQILALILVIIRTCRRKSLPINLRGLRDLRSRAIVMMSFTTAATTIGSYSIWEYGIGPAAVPTAGTNGGFTYPSASNFYSTSYQGGFACAVISVLLSAFNLWLVAQWHEDEVYALCEANGVGSLAVVSGYYEVNGTPLYHPASGVGATAAAETPAVVEAPSTEAAVVVSEPAKEAAPEAVAVEVAAEPAAPAATA